MGLSFAKIDWDEEPSTREKAYFFVVLLLIVVAMMRLLLLPTLQKIKIRKQDMNNIKLQASTLEKFIEIDKKIAPLKPALRNEAVDKHLEEALENMSENPKEVIAAVIGEIASRRLMGNVVLNSLSFETAVAHGGYATVPVSLNVLGTFSSLQNYLLMMEKLNYLFTVDNVKFTRSEDHPGLITGELKASIYVGGSKETKKQGGDK